jgi:hypothetical protein
MIIHKEIETFVRQYYPQCPGWIDPQGENWDFFEVSGLHVSPKGLTCSGSTSRGGALNQLCLKCSVKDVLLPQVNERNCLSFTTTSVEKWIEVPGTTIRIRDLTVNPEEKHWYFIISDDSANSKNMINKVCVHDPQYPFLEDEGGSPQTYIADWTSGIVKLMKARGEPMTLSNLRLVNYTTEEAEKLGLLTPPDIIDLSAP